MAKNTPVVENTEVVTNAPEVAAKPKLAFKVLKNVTLPLIKMVEESPIYVKITGAMFVGKEVKGTGTAAKMEPAILAHVVNLETGENAQIIIAEVIKGNLKDVYPEDSYVGKSFEFIKHSKREGKRYHDYSITEIEV